MEPAFADDVLCGADEIAAFLYGDAKQRRRVFYLVEKCRLPVFRMGATICMRRSTWYDWVKTQEAKASGKSGGAQHQSSMNLPSGVDQSDLPRKHAF